MREVKSRVWDKKNKTWHPFPSGLALRVTDGKLVTAVADKILSPVSEQFVYQEFTGLHDMNGKEIYEGDVVTGIDLPEIDLIDAKGEVVWHESEATWKIESEEDAWFLGECVTLKIIGNIYENPELLK